MQEYITIKTKRRKKHEKESFGSCVYECYDGSGSAERLWRQFPQSTQNNASGDEAQKEDTGNEEGKDEGGESSGPVDITIMALRDDSYTPWSETTMIKEIEEECKELPA